MLTINNRHKEGISELLEKDNLWWKKEFDIDFKPREIYEQLQKFMPLRHVIALTGLRRVGKTTIMLKIIKDAFLKYGNENIVYFSFDDSDEIRLQDVIDVYSRLMSKDVTHEKYLFLFDEIQKITAWEEQLKRLYDRYPRIKFVISGSESLFIRKKSRESLAGRMFEFQIKTLNFREYLSFRDKKFDNLLLYKEEILKEFHHFLVCNGFPEMINEDVTVIEKYIKENIIEKIVYQDITRLFKVREPFVLEQVFKIILFDPGEIINIDTLSREIGISRQTISLYLDYLENSFLIKKLYNFSRNARKTERKFKKYYPTIMVPDIIRKKELFGKIFETCMVIQLDAEFFWRDAYKNEIDVVKLVNEKIVPIEIKTSKIEYKTLKRFMKKFKTDKGIILTYDVTEKIEGIEVIPFYEFLLKKQKETTIEVPNDNVVVRKMK